MKKISILDVKAKKNKEKISMLTCYDYAFAKILNETDVDILLVGDSLGNNVLGYKDTLPVSINEMVHHTKAVVKGAERPLVVVDMPFMSYQVSEEQAIANAGFMIKETGAAAVKIEGGVYYKNLIEHLIRIGIPVMGHLGFTPQSYNQFGGFKVQAKTEEAVKQIINDAEVLQEAGVFAIVLELIPSEVARQITEAVSIPTIGIGAGKHCDGQVLVLYDILGINETNFKHNRKYMNLYTDIANSINKYSKDVKESRFPNAEESF